MRERKKEIDLSAGEAVIIIQTYSSQVNYLASTLNISLSEYVVSNGKADYAGGMYSSQNSYTIFLKNKTTSAISELKLDVSRSSNVNTSAATETVKAQFKK